MTVDFECHPGFNQDFLFLHPDKKFNLAKEFPAEGKCAGVSGTVYCIHFHERIWTVKD